MTLCLVQLPHLTTSLSDASSFAKFAFNACRNTQGTLVCVYVLACLLGHMCMVLVCNAVKDLALHLCDILHGIYFKDTTLSVSC